MSPSLVSLGLAAVTGVIWAIFLHPFWKAMRPKGGGYWVIGGHRGRHYGDNAAGVEAEARRRGVPIVWIADEGARQLAKEAGAETLVRNSWAARKAISQATALIYSHGEDDLDLLLILLRSRSAPRFYLGHSLSLLKAGGVTEPALRDAFIVLRWIRAWLITRWDWVLCASDEEAENFKLCYPMAEGTTLLGGGAHLDQWAVAKEHPPKRRLYWFPTFRDTAATRAELEGIIREVLSSESLRNWLLENDYEFFLGSHINSDGPDTALEAPFFRRPLTHLVEDIRESEVLISDYSGVVFDFLLLERPQVLFAFDLDEYQETRVLYGSYDSLDFALHPRTSAELVEMIVGGAFDDESLQIAARERRKKSLPARDGEFAAGSVDQILATLN